MGHFNIPTTSSLHGAEDNEATAVSNGQHSILEQTEAVLAGQATSAATPTSRSNLEGADLFAAEVNPNDYPPPAYRDAPGEIRAEKDGLGTSADVTDDGRVNIRINQLSRRLSQIFTPAIAQQAQSAQDTPLPPPPYVPPSLGGNKGVAPPPLNVVIQVVGSRGDVQPFVALGKVLKNRYGHRVRLATHPTFNDFVQENGLEFFSIGGDPSQLMAFMVKNPSLMPGVRSLVSGDVSKRRKDVADYMQGCWRSCYQAGDGMRRDSVGDEDSDEEARPFVADCIIANPPSFAHVHCAEKLGIPLHIMFTMPYSPTQAFPHPLANIQASNADPHLTNYISYAMIEMLSWQGLGDIINRFRAKCLGLDPISRMWAPGMLQRLKVPHTYCWSPALIPKPNDWNSLISISGFYFLDLATEYTPSPELQAFLDSGRPPVYIGFGSIVLKNPNALTELIFQAVKETGQRVLLSKGWGGMGADELNVPDGVFMLGNVPHDWLFKRVSCVVHHGGAGTTAAGIKAGRPTVVIPFFGDQPFWGAMVARAGAGPDPIPHRQLTAQKLAEAINSCLKPDRLTRAEELAKKILQERGDEMGAQLFHQFLEVDRLRCTLAPSRPAVWRVKRTQVRLSAFAACTLANENLLDFHDLKLFRAQEYETDQGPLDPISGGFVAACGAFGGMAKGLMDIPSETMRGAQLPFKRSQQRLGSSSTTASSTLISSSSGNAATPDTEESRVGSTVNPESQPAYKASNISLISSASSSVPEQRKSEQTGSGRVKVRSRDSSSASNDRDFMRPTGVHMSRGLGRFTSALVKGPMDVSMGLTKGCHNLPRMWGDDTVRPHAQVRDFKSGARAVGKELGLGWYDGITGLATLPWKGAQKEGTSGFVKGIGKGMAGFIAKPTAGLCGVLGYTMKGVQKELQGLFGTNVQSYIVGSRTAQGYEDWLQSSDTEKQEVIVRWKLVQQYLTKKQNRNDMLENILEAHQSGRMENAAGSFARPGSTTDSGQHEGGNNARTEGSLQDLDANFSAVQELITAHNSIQSERQREEASGQRAAEDADLQRVVAASEADARRQARDDADYEEPITQATAESLGKEHTYGTDFAGPERSRGEHRQGPSKLWQRTTPLVKSVAGSSSMNASVPDDHGHLDGMTREEFEAQMEDRHREKTAQERTEEEIVMEYVKKQSLLEARHREKERPC